MHLFGKDRADLSSSAEAIGLQQASRIRGEQQTPAQQGSPLPSSSMPLPGISKGLRQRLAARSGWLVCTPESMTQTAVVLVPVSSCRAPSVVTEAVSQLRRAAANTRHAAQQHRKAVLGSKRCTIIPASVFPRWTTRALLCALHLPHLVPKAGSVNGVQAIQVVRC